ncbi:MAG: helix-turn-helix domain-containing protein [Sedimenticola sp.]|uniref:Helix-turn-helix domain-containing protein n=1 Tax=Sedimenticola thiotaurini TaxID=1543721 RepID=A0A558CPL9_9GAMM|nr:helix-turn-helix domain-containing protein [Sedimenticola sp.]TVT50713.1 MAG: helix-turn-helix domain-containing protein [Sedimenticola thiotaurini]
MPNGNHHIALLAIPEVAASTLYGMYDLFASAGRDWAFLVEGRAEESLLKTQVVARTGTQPLTIANGVRIAPDADLSTVPQVVCIPEVAVPPDIDMSESHAEEIAWLRRCHAEGALIATACSGAMLLAASGLLEGEEATTHWAYCDALARYPGVKVHPQRALVVGGTGSQLIMAGGGTSWEDLALYLVARLLDVEEAMRLAKLFLIDWHDMGQLPFAALARKAQVEDAVIARCQQWIAEHYETASPVAAMIDLSKLPERSFNRRFKQATGLSPMEYVHTLRLEETKQQLEATNESIESVAQSVGYEDTAFFGRLFRRKVGLTPAQYRKRFGSLRQHLIDGILA